LELEFTPDRGTVVFPRNARGANFPAEATAFFEAAHEGLLIGSDASWLDQLQALKGAIERHLDRFALGKAPLAFNWS
jgi:hypothetical protein